jgi:hypothetical protein
MKKQSHDDLLDKANFLLKEMSFTNNSLTLVIVFFFINVVFFYVDMYNLFMFLVFTLTLIGLFIYYEIKFHVIDKKIKQTVKLLNSVHI